MTMHISRLIRIAVPMILILCFPAALPAQDQDRWSITTRWDYRVRIDGRYIGHSDRELRELFVRENPVGGGWFVSGSARMLGNTRKDGLPVASRLEDSEAFSLTLSPSGAVFDVEGFYPHLRGFPVMPEPPYAPGDRWEAPLEVSIIGPGGEKAVLPLLASYRYLGEEMHMGRPSHAVEVLWAIRYRGGRREVDSFLSSVEGSHRVRLIVDVETGSPVLARDNLNETWNWSDGRVEDRRGFALIFWNDVPPLDSGDITRRFEGSFGSSNVADRTREEDSPAQLPEDGIIITQVPDGLSVSLMNLHFIPDSDIILPEDRPLLDQLAALLQDITGRTVLVRGHTADLGRPADQQNLSEQRAKRVADELALRGIDPRRLIYEGVGALEPVASNADESGRRQNRRVELIILED